MSYVVSGQLAPAMKALAGSIELRPNANANWQLGEVCARLGDAERAIAAYEAAIGLQPKLLLQANNLAWLLSTHSDDRLRDGRRALEIASAICGQPEATASSVDTLAAAQAESGDYLAAARSARRAKQMAVDAEQHALAERIGRRLELYLLKTPFRDGE